MAAHRVVFAIAKDPLAVLVAFVGGDDDDGAHRRAEPSGLQHIGGPTDVDIESFLGLTIRAPHQRLRRQVKDNLGLERLHDVAHVLKVAHVAHLVAQTRGQTRQFEKTWFGWRWQGEAGDIGAELREPQCQPAAFETRVPGDENAPAGKEPKRYGRLLR